MPLNTGPALDDLSAKAASQRDASHTGDAPGTGKLAASGANAVFWVYPLC